MANTTIQMELVPERTCSEVDSTGAIIEGTVKYSHCWRLVEWEEPNPDGFRAIRDVMECVRYNTLRNIARGRGHQLPTEYKVGQAIARLNLPAEALFDERLHTHRVSIKDGKIICEEIATGSMRIYTGKVWGIPSDAEV